MSLYTQLISRVTKLEAERQENQETIHRIRILLREHSDAIAEIDPSRNILATPAVEPETVTEPPASDPGEVPTGLVEAVQNALFEMGEDCSDEFVENAIHAVSSWRAAQPISEEMVEFIASVLCCCRFDASHKEKSEVAIQAVREWDLRGGKGEES